MDDPHNDMPALRKHANRHVAKFLQLPETTTTTTTTSPNRLIQSIDNGKLLTAKRLLQNKNDLTLTRPILVTDTPESIGMKVLSFRQRQVAVRDIADIIGHHWPVHVIDVEHQEELEGWTLADLVEYFEDEERLLRQHQAEAARLGNSKTHRSQRRRKAAEKCIVTTASQRPRVLNQISLEFSATPLANKIKSPKFVRDLDWIDHAWPRQNHTNHNVPIQNVPPRVQYYCLTSAAGCYTDFHVDFGGTAVWYHILSGEKIFCLIPPTDENLAAYEDWLCRPNQAELFLPDMIANSKDNVIRISLQASQTLVIPTAWIHAVYTPVDSVVLGGNFLHGLDISLQLKVHCLESRTRVQEKFRFPHFLPINFYAGGMYLERLRRGKVVQREVDGLRELMNSLQEWWKVQQGQSQLQTGPTVVSAAIESARKNKCNTVEEFLKELQKEYQRVVKDGISPNPNYSPPTSPNRIKLKLKLKPEVPPSLSSAPSATTTTAAPSSSSAAPTAPTLQSSAPSSSSTTTTAADTNEFRIVVSSTKLPPARTKSKRTREDTEWIYDPTAVDDEWMPDEERRKKMTLKISNNSHKKNATKSNRGGGSTTKATKATTTTSTKKAPPAKAQKPKLNARQRLMKRFR